MKKKVNERFRYFSIVLNVAGGEHIPFLEKLNSINEALGFSHYTSGSISKVDMFFITAALMYSFVPNIKKYNTTIFHTAGKPLK